MLRVVFDTNIIISALLNEEGLPALLLDLAFSGKLQFFYSTALMREYEEVLRRKKFNLSPQKIKKALDEIKRIGIKVYPLKLICRIHKNPADNRILEVSQESDADYIITGNSRHFSFSHYKNTKIITPRKFITIEELNIIP